MTKYKVACGASTTDLERSMNTYAHQGYHCSGLGWTDNRHRCHYVIMEKESEEVEDDDRWPLF